MRFVYMIQDSSQPTLPEVGGKGLSLIKMAQNGMAVPPGFVLTVAFFQEWFRQIPTLPAWSQFLHAVSDAALKESCDDLKAGCKDFVFSESQREAVQTALSTFPHGKIFAVRSSSPEEDLEGSSFAGEYETVLGVTIHTLESAVRTAFASCLDARVVIYKREHGFNVQTPRIAVVVQQQIASDVAGVGFSLNPITNSYDEAVFSANWGLGETVVSGIASPDLFTVDKIHRRVTDRQIGKKETSIWLTSGGGTEERADPRHDRLTLSDEQVLNLTDELLRIEKLYARPMDIEWAYSEDKLYLLQARPITTHLALPSNIVSSPEEPRRLYWDVTISVQGLLKPISPMGTSVLARLLRHASENIFGKNITGDPVTSFVLACHGRLYINLSNALAAIPKEKLASLVANMDPVVGASLASLDEATYRSTRNVREVPWRLILGAPQKIAMLIEARLMPEHARRSCDRECERHLQEIRALAASKPPFDQFVGEAIERTARLMFHEIIPLFAVSKLAMSRIRDIFSDATDSQQKLVARLDQSLPGNVTVEMGLELADLARLAPDGASVEALHQGLDRSSVSGAFALAWEDFIRRYGHRGPREIDIAAPRYREQPRMLLGQIAQLKLVEDPEKTPQAIYERSQRERHEAFEALAEIAHEKGWLSSKRFQSLYRVVETLGGLRESPKFFLIATIDLLRTRALEEADALVRAGRLEHQDQIFDLTVEDLGAATRDPTLDLRTLAKQRREAPDRLARFRQLPRLFDSRGLILRPPPRALRPGEFSGHPVSPGLVQGPVKVLHFPDEKPVVPGDILVAHATDPGWTPLFVNAAAVVLEVGGMMQHGALVAREYGKPCVAGLENATERFADGTLVEVDGAAGIVRVISLQ